MRHLLPIVLILGLGLTLLEPLWAAQVKFSEKFLNLGREKVFVIVLPQGYAATQDKGADFIVNYIVPRNPQDTSARWLIYAGAFPKPFPDLAERESGTLGPFNVEWHTWKTAQKGTELYHKGAYIHEKDMGTAQDADYLGANRIFQFWVWGTDQEKVNNLTKIAQMTKFK